MIKVQMRPILQMEFFGHFYTFTSNMFLGGDTKALSLQFAAFNFHRGLFFFHLFVYGWEIPDVWSVSITDVASISPMI